MLNVEPRCKCCRREINKKYLKLGLELKELSFLGSGYPLYFIFIKSCILILFLYMIPSGFYALVSNSNATFCISYDEYDEIIDANAEMR